MPVQRQLFAARGAGNGEHFPHEPERKLFVPRSKFAEGEAREDGERRKGGVDGKLCIAELPKLPHRHAARSFEEHGDLLKLAPRAERAEGKGEGAARHLYLPGGDALRSPREGAAVHPVRPEHFGKRAFGKAVLHRNERAVLFEKGQKPLRRLAVAPLTDGKKDDVVFARHLFGEHGGDGNGHGDRARKDRSARAQRLHMGGIARDELHGDARFRKRRAEARSHRPRAEDTDPHSSNPAADAIASTVSSMFLPSQETVMSAYCS